MDKKDNLALAYAVKRRGKKLSAGGDISNSFSKSTGSSGADSAWGNLKKAVGMADGGEVSKAQQIADSFKGATGHLAHGGDLKDKVLIKIRAKKMAEGGKVDDDDPSTEAFEYLDEDDYTSSEDPDHQESDHMDDFDPEDAKKSRIKKHLSSLGK